MGDPHLGRADLAHGAAQIVPVHMVRDDERQFHAFLPGAGSDAHPARGEGSDRVWKAPRPEILDGGGRAQHDRALQVLPIGRGHLADVPHGNAGMLVERGELLHRAMDPDRPVMPRRPDQRDQALRLAERVGSDDVRALGKQGDRIEQLGDFARRVRVAEHRQAKRGLGDEHVAGNRLEGSASEVGRALVVAGDNDAPPAGLDHDLRRAQHMTGRNEGEVDAVVPDRFTQRSGLAQAGEVLAIAHGHDAEGLRGGHDGSVPGPGVVRMAMGDEGPGHRPDGVDVDIRGRAIEPRRGGGEEFAGVHAPSNLLGSADR